MSTQKNDDYSKVSTNTTKTYLTALALVGTLSVLAYVMMHVVISAHTHQAAVINVSGRQRMLSQRIALYAEYLTSAKPEERADLQKSLSQSIDLFEKSHRDLSLGSASLGLPIAEVKQIYFDAPAHLDQDVHLFISNARELATSGDDQPSSSSALATVRETQKKILPLLDQAVQLNQVESEKQVGKLQRVESLILIFTLLLLMVEALFIFRPMIRTIARLFKAAIDARERAVQATDAKSAFLATVTHEIRTPMAGVLGITEALLDVELPTLHRERVRTLHRLSYDLIAMVNDILDYSKIEAGQLKLEKIDFSLRSLANDTRTLFQPSAAKKDIQFTVEVDEALPAFAKGDPTRLRQIITNFVGNALKFTPANGSIDLRFQKISLSETIVRLRIEVQDTGEGIAKDAQAKLFQCYSQEDVSTSRSHGGTGLGLAICQQISVLMGGHIGLESEKGHGSVFWLEVDLDTSSELELAPAKAKTTKTKMIPLNAQVLVADDNDVNRQLVSAQMKKMGLSVQAVANGIEAVAAAAGQHFDLIFLDCEMPEMNGFQAARQIRDAEKQSNRPRTFIFALTGHSGLDVYRQCRESGMDELLTKPIPQTVLNELISKRLMKAG